MKKFPFYILLACLIFTSCAQSKKTKLVVYLVSDQLTPSIFIKYDTLFTGGFRWLIDNGISYTNVHHNHANTSTGPGHFALSTGVYPGKGGIIDNEWYDRDLKRIYYVVEDTTAKNFSGKSIGRSYKNINFSSLADWIKNSNRLSKIVSLSGKDRSAVLIGGSNPDLALWYDKNGGYTTSDYYLPALPSWVKKFNNDLNVASYKDSIWAKLKKSDVYNNYSRVDNFKGEKVFSSKKNTKAVLPLSFSDMSLGSLLSGFYEYPQGDRSLIDLAIEASSRLNLGKDSAPDLLFVGLSAVDGVGHHFGPNSLEQLDNYLRLDKNLMKLIDFINQKIGLDNTLFVLSSDHGVMDLPEYLIAQNIASGRVNLPFKRAVFSDIIENIDKMIGPGKVFDSDNNFYFSRDMSDEESEIATNIIKEKVLQIEGVERALHIKDIESLPSSEQNNRLKNMIHPLKSPDVYTLLKKNWLWKSVYGSSHGTHHGYDSHVPLVISRLKAKPKTLNFGAYTVDIPASIAEILGLSYPKTIDGRPLPVDFEYR